jgi:predicted transcriptional regulator
MARIFTTEELLELLDQGLTQKEAAERLGVSPAAVSKRMKRLPPPSLTKLTPKERMFVECRAKGVSQTESVCQSYEVSSRQSAKALGHTLSKNPNISTALADLMEYKGIGRERRVERLAEHVENQDPTVSLKALDTCFKISGYQQKNDVAVGSIKLVDLSEYLMEKDAERVIDVTPEES